MEMDSELKARWLAALRGGEYKQGRGRLGTEDHLTSERKYCCLAVLCDITKNRLTAAGIRVEWSKKTLFVDGMTNYPSAAVCDALGLPAQFWGLTGLPYTRGDNTLPNLDVFNDGGLTFEQIADVIEWAL